MALIVSRQFDAGAKASARAFGMPGARYVLAPKIFRNITVQEGIEQAKPVLDDLARLLTTDPEPTAAPVRVARDPRALESFEGADQFDALQKWNDAFLERDWGDGYPLIQPTQEAVEAMLGGTNRLPDYVLCDLPPGGGIATVWKVAINAAMAGASPEHMPVILAALKALSQVDEHTVNAFLKSTASDASLLLVNGPIAKELGINGEAAMGPARVNRANLAIGRAYTLCLKNIGHWYLGGHDADTLGSARKFTVCVAENEDALRSWEPFHVEQGFRADESVVTLFGTRGEVEVIDDGHTTAEGVLKTLAYNAIFCQWDMQVTNKLGNEKSTWETIMFVAPDAVKIITGAGFTKKSAREFIHHHARHSLGKMAHYAPFEEDTINPEWRWLVHMTEKERDEIIMTIRESADRYRLVCVGAGRAKSMIMPSRNVIPQSVDIDQYRADRKRTQAMGDN